MTGGRERGRERRKERVRDREEWEIGGRVGRKEREV